MRGLKKGSTIKDLILEFDRNIFNRKRIILEKVAHSHLI